MSSAISQATLVAVGDVVRDRLGLHFPSDRMSDLESALRGVAVAFGCDGVETAAHRILSQPLAADDLNTLAQALTVGETNFCRDAQVFALLQSEILPAIIARRRDGDRRIRIWSAGCCTGEEPYTVAMILHRLLPDIADWNVTILATDINTEFLSRAQTAVYGKWSFRRTPAWMTRRHFSRRDDGKLELHRDVRRLVKFDYLNLADATYPSLHNQTNAMDLVLCRNVLIYFDAPSVQRVIERLRSCLLPDGCLILGRSERVPAAVDGLQLVGLRGEFCYRRADRRGERDGAEEGAGRAAGPPRRVRATPFPGTVQARFDGGEYAAVVSDLTHFLDQGTPSRADRRRAMRILAQACANLGRLAEAQGWCEAALAEDKLDAHLHYLHASVLLERNLAGEAETSLQRALAADDRFVLAHFALGNLNRRSRRPQRAREHFQRTLSLLRHHGADEILPGSEGLSAGRLSEIARRALAQC